jgi:hypothetical protein
LYCNVLRGQLTHHENKKNAPAGKGWLVGDGMPHLLSGDEFYEKVVEFMKEQEKTEREKKVRLQAQGKRAEAMKGWKERDEA